jgi:hypothetical protein
MTTALDASLPSEAVSTLDEYAQYIRESRAAINSLITELANVEVDPPSSMNDSDIVFTDITTGNVSTTKHGFAPKGDNDLTHYLNGHGAYAQVADTHLATDDNTTNNVSAAKHGFCPKLSNDGSDVLRGDGTFGSPVTDRHTAAGAGVSGSGTGNITVVGQNLVVNDMVFIQCSGIIDDITDPGTLDLSISNNGTATIVFGHSNEVAADVRAVTTAMNGKYFSICGLAKCTGAGSLTARFVAVGPTGSSLSDLEISIGRL